jgi:hypothetical protein
MRKSKTKKKKTEKKKDLKKIIKKAKRELNLREERFCILYASDREFFGNGVQSYIEAYNIDLTKKGAYNTARVSAHDLLTKPNILKKIDKLLDDEGLNDTFVDKQLKFAITQCANINAKIKAITEYNALKGRRKPVRVIPEGEDGGPIKIIIKKEK